MRCINRDWMKQHWVPLAVLSIFLCGAASLTAVTWQPVSLATLSAGEDQTNNVLRTEGQFTHSAVVTADTQVKATAGFLHCILISENDAAPTAGTIDILDNTSAGSSPKVFSWTLTTTVFNPIQLCPDIVMTTGIYIDFTTTGDVNVMVSYR